MIATAKAATAPIFGARLHARPPGGAEPRSPDPVPGSRPGAAPGAALGATDAAKAEAAELARLAARDRAVRAHEVAHARVGGRHAGAPRFDFVTGPDGRRYAIDGEVGIDLSAVPGDAGATIDKMQTIREAALAPANPSPADRQIAAMAERMIRAAEAELTAERKSERLDAARLSADRDGTPAGAAGGSGISSEELRLARLATLFVRLAVLPAPEPSFSMIA